MKQILLFLFLNLFWINISLADLYDLKINLNTSEEITEKIEKLNDLYKSGVLTEEEFKKAKERILN